VENTYIRLFESVFSIVIEHETFDLRRGEEK
jgi:hypothetical protein